MNDATHTTSWIGLRRTVVAALFAGVLLLVAGCGATASRSATTSRSATALPDTPAGAQGRWLLGASARLPIPRADLVAHFDPRFLRQVSPAAVNNALAGVGAELPGSGRVRVEAISVDEPRALVAELGRASSGARLTVSLQVDGQGLISRLRFKPLVAAVGMNWQAIDAAVHSAAPDVHMLVADTTSGGCRTIHAIDARKPAPLGSAFKLYVLDALGSAVVRGRVAWAQSLTVSPAVKSLPSGVLQTLPNGTRVSVREAADKMISISDNTAADMLIGLLGRASVEAAVRSTGMSDPALDIPFLTTRELFQLKADGWPALAARYAHAGVGARRALLFGLKRLGLPGAAAIRAWIEPRAVDSIEWFASAEDLCRVYTSLSALARRPGLEPISGALSINDGGLGLDPARWRSTWFKGGSEPGVLTLTYQATTRGGRTFFVAVLTHDPNAPVAEARADARLLSAITATFALAAASGS